MKKIMTMAAAVLCLAACTKNNPAVEFCTELTASLENGVTKTHLEMQDGVGKVLWDANDEISVFSVVDGAYVNSAFATAEGGATAVFKGPGIDLADNVFALYPADESASFSAEAGFAIEADYTSQKLVVGNIDPKLNLAAGKYAGEKKLSFRNAGALLSFTLTQERADTIRRIEIKANDGTPLAFKGAAAMTWNDGAPVVTPASEAEKSDVVKLSPAAETFVSGSTYYVWILPGNYAGGITLTLVSPTQMTAVKAGTTALSAGRNQIVDLGEIGGLEWKAKETEKKALHFDFTGTPQEGWPTKDKWKDVANGDPNPCPGDSTCVYNLDGEKYNFILTDCGNATQARTCWDPGKGGLIWYAGWRYLGLPAIEGFRLIKVTGKLCLSSNSKRKGGVTTGVVADNTTGKNEFVTGGEEISWATKDTEYTYNLEGTAANTVYYLCCTATSMGTYYLDLVYEKVE